MVANRAGQQADADDAVADDHHRRKHRVTGKGIDAGAVGQHHGYDQRDFDDRHRHRQNQRAEGFAQAVGNDFSVEDGNQDAGDQRGTGQGEQQAGELATPERCQ